MQNADKDNFHERMAREGVTARNPEGSNVEGTLALRGKRYGSFDSHAQVTQDIKEAMQRCGNTNMDRGYIGSGWTRLSADQKEALEMIAHKIGRILNGDPNYADSWHDIAGYAKLVDDRLQGVKTHG